MGATDDIGRSLAFRLAAVALGLVLVGRSADKLTTVSAEARARRPGVQVRTFVLDFAGDGLAAKATCSGSSSGSSTSMCS
jgi:17beta-estradiol 17-dehydrogenase / very-long-chain 3-oxoacyl-CoA reductase